MIIIVLYFCLEWRETDFTIRRTISFENRLKKFDTKRGKSKIYQHIKTPSIKICKEIKKKS